ncbi:MAG TPA: lysine--tRNA ligase [Candidatus Babeliales bacterium]|nr:lysine--tRNA ligase [Candidatus Babeliales bacterium]
MSQELELSGESKIRAQKVDTLRKQGVEPWPAAQNVTDTCELILKHFGHHDQKPTYTIAGRLVSIRSHGKTIFAHLQDRTAKIQIYIKDEHVGAEQFEFFKHMIDIGDILWAMGPAFRTKMGEVTLEVKSFKLLSKCLHPLPEKFHGLTDVEVRYRQRYLDLISNPESREKFIRRTGILKSVRNFLDAHGFMEVETPMLHPIAGGAAARPFVTHHNALGDDFYLRIAPELYLKRLVVGGFERVYEINRNFRNEGVSTRHNPEFTMLEFYMAHHNYLFIMEFVEQLLRSAVEFACGTLEVRFGDHVIDFGKPFKRISVKQSVLDAAHLTDAQCSDAVLNELLKTHRIKLAQNASNAVKFYALFEKIVEPTLIQPTFITEYPIEISPLAKRDSENPAVAARYELFIGGMEISNGFNELNDPFDQADRFKQQLEAHKAGDEEAHQYDADYIQALEYALPPTVGVGIGIDRLVMLLTNTTSIKDVILFPTLKKKHS